MSNPFDFVKDGAHFDKALFLYDFALTFATIRTFSMYLTTSLSSLEIFLSSFSLSGTVKLFLIFVSFSHDDVWRTVRGLNLDNVKKVSHSSFFTHTLSLVCLNFVSEFSFPFE
jgi:hypothetical protein